MKKGIQICMSIISLIVSVVALFVAIIRSEPIQAEWASLLVGILSVLVTALIGWNIYTLVDITSTKKKIDEISKGTSLYIEKYMTVSEGANWMIYHYLLLNKDPLGLEYRFIYHGISCLMHASRINDIKTCDIIVKGLLECINNPQNITFRKERKNDILKLISSIKCPEKISGFFELLNRLALIRTE